jgi:hypothetical protein
MVLHISNEHGLIMLEHEPPVLSEGQGMRHDNVKDAQLRHALVPYLLPASNTCPTTFAKDRRQISKQS